MTTAKRSIAASMMEFLSSKLLLVLIAVALIAASIYLWKTQETRDRAQLAVEVNSKVRSYASETENRYDRIYGALDLLASRGAPAAQQPLPSGRRMPPSTSIRSTASKRLPGSTTCFASGR